MKGHSTQLLLLSLIVAGGAVLSSCTSKGAKDVAQALKEGIAEGQSASDSDSDDETYSAPTTADWDVSGNTMTYGDHTYTIDGNIDAEQYVPSSKAKVTFTNVPSDYEEFRTVYEEFLGKSIYGVTAMLPMAFELWGRDHEVGKQCIALITGGTCYNEIMRQLPDHMVANEHAPAGDGYAQRCLPAAILEGATKENGYNPKYPYTVNITIGQKARWAEESEILQAYCYHLYLISGNAWNTPQRSVTVMRQWRGDGLYRINNCSALYINIFVPRQDWNGLK